MRIAGVTDPPDDDAQLMTRLGRGEVAALGELAARHQQRVRSVAYRLCGRWDVADDLTQDTFLRVLRAAKRYQPTAAFSTWLHRIVVNLCLDRGKRPVMRLITDGTVGQQTTESSDAELLRQERAAAVQREINDLPERQRVAVILHRMEGMTHSQVAQVTGWSESAVESLLVRAYSQLRDRLRPWSAGG